jgi:outer membrane cobalamin receptor
LRAFKKKIREKLVSPALLLGIVLLLGTTSRAAELKETDPSQSTPTASSDEAAAEPDSPVTEASNAKDLTQMSLESLTGLNVVVTSSAKRAESLRDATSAIYVITSEDIHRSGFQHLADLLRMVPGVQDNQNNASEWGISARGFNAQFNNKMLVLVDGRSVYENNRG